MASEIQDQKSIYSNQDYGVKQRKDEDRTGDKASPMETPRRAVGEGWAAKQLRDRAGINRVTLPGQVIAITQGKTENGQIR